MFTQYAMVLKDSVRSLRRSLSSRSNKGINFNISFSSFSWD